ncbi:F-box protein [Hordeum vulgare]|uniref:F-box protein At2g32560-like isoform X1 n=1 Tax=Hordeum vulgare subsp. vulgare TaxID=112509 RepID=UPI000B487C43|nr:F-box protein At2g32560-like isoform X1 [Hordeum vulgare subsp. vulgare]KAE8797746.1 F-box protein [Hordeum vulgare]
MLPLLLISTLPAFTLLLVARASYKPWKLVRELGLVALLLARELLRHSASAAAGRKEQGARMPPPPPSKATTPPPALAEDDDAAALPVLDLPELALERVLEELSPASLAAMACVCAGLRDRCSMDSLWARHVRRKWGRVLGAAARREWGAELAAAATLPRPARRRGWADSLACAWPFSWIGRRWLKEEDAAAAAARSSPAPPADSVAAWYRALECGDFWFPAQVYNREQDGHVGFLLSCYDAHLRYDRRTDTFTARYPPHGRKPAKEEEGVQWCRVRAAPLSTPAQDLHASGCLEDLRPGDHFEIQWRKNKDFPYGWWYGVVGHLESCNANEHLCRCHEDDTIMLEFKHYAAGSRWRQTTVSRKDHREKGDETDGFYGGIRKLQTKDEISTWRRFWPVDVLS